MWTVPRPNYSTEGEIMVNIGGVRVALLGDVLQRYPESRLAELLRCSSSSSQSLELISSLCDDFDASRKEFYFDRDPDAFKCIMDVYYFDEIHIKRGLCPICFLREMEFWRIESCVLDECCRSDLSEKEDELKDISDKVKVILEDLEVERCSTRIQRCQRSVWRLMEKPGSSVPARVIAIASFLSILLSALVMCVGTIPELQVKDADGELMEHPTLEAIETTCMMWFTVEFLLRFASSPHKLHFILSVMNVIDFMAIAPFYVVLSLTYLSSTSMMELTNVQQAVQALRITRIARIFKLARHSSGLQTLTYALQRSLKELGLLLMYMGVGIFVFSALGYTMEQSHPETMFRSIPHSFWWAIITMTTVGYGDIYPKTTLGKCNAALSFLCGVIAIALPIHPIINNFVIFYNKQKVLESAAKHEVELMQLQDNRDGRKESRERMESMESSP
ncbi:potassium voltage-gated channel subfamily F member 1-like [Gouania willdenowi]|uniref:potassium voltage-gated channel subfamily F member 1-like n=1 Tax=Gouania willdenowi TaxID=441366 RepID=UPI001055F929|nr:potassium voltage-gated channel subfamily F member 1-like [Gouania willdenowi]